MTSIKIVELEAGRTTFNNKGMTVLLDMHQRDLYILQQSMGQFEYLIEGQYFTKRELGGVTPEDTPSRKRKQLSLVRPKVQDKLFLRIHRYGLTEYEILSHESGGLTCKFPNGKVLTISTMAYRLLKEAVYEEEILQEFASYAYLPGK